MAAPLLIGSNIRNLNAFDLETFSNTEVIAVDQDILGVQGSRLNGSSLSTGESIINVWGRPLADDSYALIFINNGDTTADIECNAECFGELGLTGGDTLNVRDLWAHTDNGTTTGQTYVAYNVAPQGGSVIVKLTPA